jgi:flagellar motor switch/type III secretory pathway protein FliN
VPDRVYAPYPWRALEILGRRSVRATASVRRALERSIAIARLEQAIGAVLDTTASVVVRDVAATGGDSPAGLAAHFAFESADGSVRFVLALEPELVSFSLSRVLKRPFHLAATHAPIEDTLAGAISAIVIEIARQTQAALPLRVLRGSPADLRHALLGSFDPSSGDLESVRIDATLLLDQRPYAVSLWAREHVFPTHAPRTELSLDELGNVGVALPLVVGLSSASREELLSLGPGDAWLPGAGWWIDKAGVGRGVLASPLRESGVDVDLAPGARIVLRGEAVAFAAETGGSMTESDQATEELKEAVLDAPVIIRIELGSVSMSAREWARLRPGDVIETGQRLAEPVTLRIAGREVARGELVSVEGELGVRIRRIADGDTRE